MCVANTAKRRRRQIRQDKRYRARGSTTALRKAKPETNVKAKGRK